MTGHCELSVNDVKTLLHHSSVYTTVKIAAIKTIFIVNCGVGSVSCKSNDSIITLGFDFAYTVSSFSCWYICCALVWWRFRSHYNRDFFCLCCSATNCTKSWNELYTWHVYDLGQVRKKGYTNQAKLQLGKGYMVCEQCLFTGTEWGRGSPSYIIYIYIYIYHLGVYCVSTFYFS